LVAAGLVLPACGAGGGGATKPEVVQVEVTGDAKKVEIKAPQKIKDGLVQVDLKNSSKGPRDAQLVRVEGDHAPDEFLKVVSQEGSPIPGWIQDGGGVGTTPPGQTRSATQQLEPGKYFAVALPDMEGGDPAATEMEVEAGGPQGELPETEGEIIAKDYSFEAKDLKAGKSKVLFKNEGQELHHVVGGLIMPGKTIDDVKKFASSEGEPSGPPPIDFAKAGISTAVIDGGVEQVIDLDLKKGKYGLLCFISDRKGGPPHVMKGMIAEVEVK
jgi:hypothetical protein